MKFKSLVFLAMAVTFASLGVADSAPKGQRFDREGIHALFLQGSSYEMALQHGTLLKEEIPKGAVLRVAKLIPDTVREILPNSPVAQALLVDAINIFIENRIVKFLEEKYADQLNEYKDALRGLSEGAGIPEEMVQRAGLAPDTLMILAKLTMGKGGLEAGVASVSGNCSSIAAWDDYTKNRNLIIGRNLDFALTGAFDRYPALIYLQPDDGQKFLIISSAGLHVGGLTAINESGIYIAAHTVPTVEASAKGVPPFLTGTVIMKQARTFDEAANLFIQAPAPSGWAYDLISVREGRVATVEISNEHVSVRESTHGKHIQTNDYLTAAMHGKALYINKSVDMDSAARYQRLDELAEANRGKIDPEMISTFLGDQVDPLTGQVHGAGNTVAVHTTVGSVVLDPAAGLIYVASGLAPAPHHPYVSFPLPWVADASTFESETVKILNGANFPAKYPELAKAELKFIDAKVAYENEGDAEGGFQLMNEAVAIDPANPHYYFVQSMLAMRAGHINAGETALRSMLTTITTPHQRDLAHYYLGRISGGRGDTAVALAELSRVTERDGVDPKLKAAAEKAFDKIQRRGGWKLKTSTLSVMIQQADMENY